MFSRSSPPPAANHKGIGEQHLAQMRLAKDNDVIQTFSANGPDQSFGKSVLPWRAGRNRFVSNAHGPEALSYD